MLAEIRDDHREQAEIDNELWCAPCALLFLLFY
jgi:hypothetical protein